MGHEETIRKLWSAFDRHDGDTAFALYTTDSVAYDIGYSEPLRGREANRKIYDEALKSLPNHQPSRINLLVKGNVAAAELFSSSINTGPLTLYRRCPKTCHQPASGDAFLHMVVLQRRGPHGGVPPLLRSDQS